MYDPVNMTSIPWISGSPPLGVPVCGFYGELCIVAYKPIKEVVLGVVGGLLLIFIVISTVVYRYTRLMW